MLTMSQGVVPKWADRFRKADAAMPFEDKYFDVAVSTQVVSTWRT
jgi:hypothetical protein